MGMARQSTSRGLYLAYRNILYHADNIDTYDFATFDKEATNGEPPYPVRLHYNHSIGHRSKYVYEPVKVF